MTEDEQEKWNEYNRLWKVAKDKGYKTGWVGHQWKDKYGNWPPSEWKDKLEGREPCPQCGGSGWAA